MKASLKIHTRGTEVVEQNNPANYLDNLSSSEPDSSAHEVHLKKHKAKS